MVVLHPAVCLLLSCIAQALQQQPLLPQSEDTGKDELIDRLRNAEIISDLVDVFKPQVRLSLTWSNASAAYGNDIDPKYLQDQPTVALQYWPDEDQDLDAAVKGVHQPDYVVVLTDPDAPSYKDPKWSQVCHWITAGIYVNGRDPGIKPRKPRQVVPYKAPGPPPKTGPHRYVALALTPLNGTIKKLHLSKPAERKRWGYDKERAGVREWAEENGLGVIGANFIYAQNHEQ